MKCKNCDREITDDMFTVDGCIWCSFTYWRNKHIVESNEMITKKED